MGGFLESINPYQDLIGAGMGILGNVAAGIQGSRMGKKQMEYGRNMLNEGRAMSAAWKRPDMNTPEAYQMMVDMAKGRMYQRLPGANMYENQIGQATASGVNALKEMGTGAEAYGGIAGLYGNDMAARRNLAIQDARYRDNAQTGYMGALQGLGNWQQQAWQWNEANPYLMAQEKAAQLESAGRQGEWEGLKNKMGSWAETFKGIGSAFS